MNKQEIKNIFDKDLHNPEFKKQGNALYDQILKHAKEIVQQNRAALVEVLREWIALKIGPQTDMAVDIAGELKLVELREQIKQLRKDITEGRAFSKPEVWWADKALKVLDKEGS